QVGFQVFEGELGSSRPQFAGLATQALDPQLRSAKFDLNLTLLRGEGGSMVADARFALDLFEVATVERWLELYELLLEQLVAAPARRLSSFGPDRPADRALLAAINASAIADYPREASLAMLFGRVAAAHPELVALAHRGESLTYARLESEANRLAHLLQSRGV